MAFPLFNLINHLIPQKITLCEEMGLSPRIVEKGGKVETFHPFP